MKQSTPFIITAIARGTSVLASLLAGTLLLSATAIAQVDPAADDTDSSTVAPEAEVLPEEAEEIAPEAETLIEETDALTPSPSSLPAGVDAEASDETELIEEAEAETPESELVEENEASEIDLLEEAASPATESEPEMTDDAAELEAPATEATEATESIESTESDQVMPDGIDEMDAMDEMDATDAMDATDEVTTSEPTIVEVAAADESFNTLVSALEAADLVSTLSGEGPYTVFAPTDAAFAALPPSVLEQLLLPENQAVLAALLSYHVIPGTVTSSDIAPGEVTTVEGTPITVMVSDGTVTVNNATVTTADIEASNGVIHVVDQVILPPALNAMLTNMPETTDE